MQALCKLQNGKVIFSLLPSLCLSLPLSSLTQSICLCVCGREREEVERKEVAKDGESLWRR